MFHKIVVPLDGSVLAEQALVPAMELSKTLDAELVLLRSIQPVYMMAPVAAGEYEWIWPEYAREDSRREIRDYLGGVKNLHCHDCPARTLALEGDPAGVIVDTVEAEHADLVVMSAHGENGMRRVVFGSVTERVLHSVACPVLVVRGHEPIQRILITLDGSPLAERAIEPALTISRALHAHVVLLRINEALPVHPRELAELMEWEVEGAKRGISGELRQEAESYLRGVMDRYELSAADAQTIVLDGHPVDRIQEFSRLYGIDLIAMSTHGRSGLKRWIYGSVTSKVMHACERSMLIIRPPAEELTE